MDAYLESLALMADSIRTAGKLHLIGTLRWLLDSERSKKGYESRLHTLAVILDAIPRQPEFAAEIANLLELFALTARSYRRMNHDPFTESRQDELGVLNWLPESASDE